MLKDELHSYLSFISEARIQYDIFYNPQAQRTGVHPTHPNPHTNTTTSVCIKKLEKITLTRTHTKLLREKNHRHKESPPKTCILYLRTFARTQINRTHISTATRKFSMCAWVQCVRIRAKLSLACMCSRLTLARVRTPSYWNKHPLSIFELYQFCTL